MARSPGGVAERTITERNILISEKAIQYTRGRFNESKAYDGANTGYEDELREGTLLGVITASNLWVPCKRTTVTSGGGATAAVIPVVDARAFRVGDTISVGADTGKVILSVDYAANTITITTAAFTFANSEAVVAEDGSQTCRGILNEFLKFKDRSGTWRRQETGKIIISGGIVGNAMLLGDAAAILADTGNKIGGIKLGNDYAAAAVQ